MKEKFVRKLTKASSHSYVLTVPKELVNKFKWREHQKLEIIFDGKRPEFTVRDWKDK